MANKRISALDDITLVGGTSTAEVNANDILPITDVDDTTGSSDGTTKGVKVSDLMGEAPVQSVNTQTGAVVLDADDVDDSSTSHKFVTASDITNLGNLSGANTGDQDLSSYQLQPTEGAFVDGDKTKLDGIEASADVTDATNVQSAGALMDSEVTNLAQVKAFDSADYATAAQGTLAGTATQPGDLGTAATSASTDFSPAFFSTVSETTTARTLSNSDNGKIIVCNNTALVTVTVPTGLTSGFNCKVIQEGAGKVKVVGASGVTLSLIGGYNTTTAQYAVVDLVNYASETYVLDSSNIGLDPSAWSGNTISTSYDGSDDYAVASSLMSFTGEFSISFWLRKGTTQSSGNAVYFANASTGAGPYAYSRFSASGGDFLIRGGPSLTASSTTVVNSNWHNFMITRSSSNLISIYKNGSSLTSATWSGTFNFDRFMGGTSGLGYFEALFDEVAVWDSDQSANASNIYNSGSPDNLSTYAPLHWWRMGDSDSPSDGDTTPTSIPDIGSDGSNTLTLTNGPTYSTTVA